MTLGLGLKDSRVRVRVRVKDSKSKKVLGFRVLGLTSIVKLKCLGLGLEL